MSQDQQPEALRLAELLEQECSEISMSERFASAAELRRLHAENKEMREALKFVERWAVHHGTKPFITPEEALSCIQHYPSIRAITDSYTDGNRPETFDPYARVQELEAQLVTEAARTASEKRRADQMTEQHRMQADMHAQARAQLAQRKPLTEEQAKKIGEEAFRAVLDDLEDNLHVAVVRGTERAHGIGEAAA